jgi:hypothetical protein
MAKSKKKSLNLLKENTLNADLNVLILVVQKLIKKNDVKPINSQPKNNTIKLPAVTRIIILIIKLFNNIKSLSTRGS